MLPGNRFQAIIVDRVSHWLPFPEALPHKMPRREQGQSWLAALNLSWKLWVILARGYGTWEEGGWRAGEPPQGPSGKSALTGELGILARNTIYHVVVNFELCPSPSRFKLYLVGAQALWTDPRGFLASNSKGLRIKSIIGRFSAHLSKTPFCFSACVFRTPRCHD